MMQSTIDRLAKIAAEARDHARSAAGQDSIREPGNFVDVYELTMILERQEALAKLVAELAEISGTGLR